MVQNKKQCTFTCLPSVYQEYSGLVQAHYGNNQVSCQLERLILAEIARLKGDVDGRLQNMVSDLRDVSSSVQNTDSKAFLVKTVDSLDAWVQSNRGQEFAATDVTVDYALLQRKYTGLVKRADDLTKLLVQKECYEPLLELAVSFGLNLDTAFENLTDVVDKLLQAADDPAQSINPEFMQTFINLLEVGKSKREIERQMRTIQRKTYQGKGRTPVPDSDSSEAPVAEAFSAEKV